MPCVIISPVESIGPVTVTPVLTTRPLFGEIIATAEPLTI